jgi:hypothetical protein
VTFGLGALMALTKSKKHFVGITWVDGDKKGGFVMQCDKNDYRGILLGLEGVTGKKAVDSDAMTVKTSLPVRARVHMTKAVHHFGSRPHTFGHPALCAGPPY